MLATAPFGGGTGHVTSRMNFGAAALGGMRQDRAVTMDCAYAEHDREHFAIPTQPILAVVRHSWWEGDMSAVVMDFGRSAEHDTEVVLDLPGWEAYLVEFDQHATALLRLAVLLTGGDHHGAQDLVQETFVAGFPAWRAGQVDNLAGYLRRSLTNRVTSAGRRLQVAERFRVLRRGDDRGGRSVDDEVADHVSLGAALRALPPKQRAAVVLRFYEGLSVAECAEHLQVSTGTIKSQTSDALSALRQAMEAAR